MASPIPQNKVELGLDEIAAVVGGEVMERAAERVQGVTTDSREDVRGKLFVALEGEFSDGHAFAESAARAGAAALVVSREVKVRDVSIVRVGSTLDALAALAGRHRRRSSARVVAVAGSAGKTTTRSAIAALLTEIDPKQVHAPPGNLNNRIGVPMVLLGLEERHKSCVLEIGTNSAGEVRFLADIAAPDLALLTLIGVEHAAGLGDLDAIEREEGSVFQAVHASAIAIANGDDLRVVRQLEQSRALQRLRYGRSSSCEYRLFDRVPVSLDRVLLIVERAATRLRLHTPLLGEAGALATVAAYAAVELVLGRHVEPDLVGRALTKAAREPGRLVPIELSDGTIVLDDTYNANPPSVRSSIAVAEELARTRGARLVLVLGEMRELGASSESEHRSIGEELARTRAIALIALSGDAIEFVNPARADGVDAVFAEDAETALREVLARTRGGDVILIKASRGVRAERIVAGLVAARGRAA